LNRESRTGRRVYVPTQAGRKDSSRCMFWRQNVGPDTEDTLGFGGTEHCESRIAKNVSGGCVQTQPRYVG
jgi:hypothetical protein